MNRVLICIALNVPGSAAVLMVLGMAVALAGERLPLFLTQLHRKRPTDVKQSVTFLFTAGCHSEKVGPVVGGNDLKRNRTLNTT